MWGNKFIGIINLRWIKSENYFMKGLLVPKRFVLYGLSLQQKILKENGKEKEKG
jgi:hypothetical protein